MNFNYAILLFRVLLWALYFAAPFIVLSHQYTTFLCTQVLHTMPSQHHLSPLPPHLSPLPLPPPPTAPPSLLDCLDFTWSVIFNYCTFTLSRWTHHYYATTISYEVFECPFMWSPSAARVFPCTISITIKSLVHPDRCMKCGKQALLNGLLL